MLSCLLTKVRHAGGSRTCLWGSWDSIQGNIIIFRNDGDTVACSLKVVQDSHTQPILPALQRQQTCTESSGSAACSTQLRTTTCSQDYLCKHVLYRQARIQTRKHRQSWFRRRSLWRCKCYRNMAKVFQYVMVCVQQRMRSSSSSRRSTFTTTLVCLVNKAVTSNEPC